MPKKQTEKKGEDRFAVLFGFNVEDKDRTGYLKVGKTGYSVTEDPAEATAFSLNPESGKGTPKDWCRFFKSERDISNWRFHPVIMVKRLS